MSGSDEIERARAALKAWGISPSAIERIVAGHINLTFKVSGQHTYALQRLAAMFDPSMHYDIEFVTARLSDAGMPTPRLVPAGRRLWIEDQHGDVWRMLTWMDGRVLLAVDGAARAREAGRLLGRFHRALWGSDHRFEAARIGVHDTSAHLAGLEKAIDTWRAHRHYDAVARLAGEILKAADNWTLAWDDLPQRVVHGDPKISNLVFDEHGRAVCLIDLDTLGRMALACDLGDAFRSWCQPAGEDSAAPFDGDLFEAGIQGFAETIGDLPDAQERESIAPAVRAIAVELASRFCLDAYEESYFGWDAVRFESASAHNQLRARSQLELARSIDNQLGRMQQVVQRAFRRG